MKSTGEMVAQLREALGGRAGVRLALLFGSWARGNARPDSDIDLAVLGPEVDRLGLAAELTNAFGLDVQVVALDRDLGVPMLEELVRDAIVVCEGAPGAAASWRTRALVDLETDRPWYARMRDAWLRHVAEAGP